MVNVFVGDLSYFCTQSDLVKLFGALAPVVRATIRRTLEGDSRHFGFVEIESQEDAEKAVKKFHGVTFMGRTIRVKICEPGSHDPPTSLQCTHVHVSFLSNKMEPQINEGFLTALFSSRFGPVVDCLIKRYSVSHHPTERQAGYGFLSFKELADAQRAMSELTGSAQIDGVCFDCKTSREYSPCVPNANSTRMSASTTPVIASDSDHTVSEITHHRETSSHLPKHLHLPLQDARSSSLASPSSIASLSSPLNENGQVYYGQQKASAATSSHKDSATRTSRAMSADATHSYHAAREATALPTTRSASYSVDASFSLRSQEANCFHKAPRQQPQTTSYITEQYAHIKPPLYSPSFQQQNLSAAQHVDCNSNGNNNRAVFFPHPQMWQQCSMMPPPLPPHALPYAVSAQNSHHRPPLHPQSYSQNMMMDMSCYAPVEMHSQVPPPLPPLNAFVTYPAHHQQQEHQHQPLPHPQLPYPQMHMHASMPMTMPQMPCNVQLMASSSSSPMASTMHMSPTLAHVPSTAPLMSNSPPRALSHMFYHEQHYPQQH